MYLAGATRVSPRLARRLVVDGTEPDAGVKVPWAVGAFLLIRRAAWDEIGGFDGGLWMYAEDLDLGWRMRQAGWFTRYEKRFPTLGIEAYNEFTGNPLPEVNRPVALLSLSFARRLQEEKEISGLSLAEVPTILLGECWNEMRLIATEGSGFDANWEKTTEFK